MRRRLSFAVAAITAVALLASPTSAAAPAVGHWAPIGPPVPTLFDTVTPLAFDSVQGSLRGPDGRLYFYGSFKDAGGDPTADNLAVYDPVTNSVAGLGSNGAGDGAFTGTVYTAVFVGSTLYVGGSFLNAAGIAAADALAAWSGTAWSARPGTSGTVLSLATVGGKLYASGGFVDWGGVLNADNLAIWDGRSWSGLGATPISGVVDQALPLPDGRVFAVGRFDNAGGNPAADRAAFWDPASGSWKSIAGTSSGFFNGDVYSIVVIGSRIVFGGGFLNAAGKADADRIVEWTGSAWKAYVNTPGVAALGSGLVTDVAVYGSNIVVSGTFASAAGVAGTGALAVFNGSKWIAAGNPLAGLVASLDVVGRTLYIASPNTSLAGGAVGIAAYGLPAAPSVPRSLHATAGTKRVTLTWLVPTAVNGASIRDYVVQYHKVGVTKWTTFADGVKTTRSAVVTGLASGSSYVFRVLAKNDWGTGLPSVIAGAKAN